MPVLSQHTIQIPNLPLTLQGLRVVQLSDFHRCRFTSDAVLREAVVRANALRPDIVLLSGDFVTADRRDIAPCAEIIGPLCARLGVYAGLGNHDYTAGADETAQALRDQGIVVLINQNHEVAPGLRIVGLDDDRHGRPDIASAWEGISPKDAVLVMAHNPAYAEKLADRTCVVFSGHTHGGQIKLPFLTKREVRRIGAKHYISGWFTLGKARLYVNRGVGQVGVALRFLCPPEIALFTLQAI